ncbi:glycosyltransferase [Rhodococcus erythropolis]|uniref:Glycosyltransferase n=1 Tax=Rhodococcus erythropolis TaxID=1833 RepID=A0A7Z6WRP4_RHOER|nr:mannosyltransferase [Rhodococcus sp. BH4]ATI36189.1 mannosyltransferase [Rhodococcus sp. H-CA8f]AUS35091.1 mannosyltransferase [Rhodococcus qingshengii]AZI64968.1 glycosyltransferase [Rhodococcus sp. NJ-530]KPH16408.1 mannosyltransferase [Rhodococcus sp. ADH]KZF14171.1 mannosyltransferase [Rhodococcus sp. EPR-134]MBH5144419.1 glycosyltransferase [Rhodococcus erythropolis]OMQ31625.1 mannosyltransferase [Rhodococcus sp. D-1]
MSVVVPVYQGEHTLNALIDEILPLTKTQTTPGGRPLVVEEVLLVFDHGPDGSAAVIRELARQHDFIRPIWLSRNFGQHPATLAGMASSGGEWVVTMDEDGQHDPADIGGLLDTALDQQATLVYAQPVNAAPHGALRNAASKSSKWLTTKILSSENSVKYQSFRLVLGEVGRSVAAYAGSEAYLDVALGWIAGEVTTSPVQLREERGRASGYHLRSLLSHFWRMVLSSGTKGLRMVSLIGFLFAVGGLVIVLYVLASYVFFDAGVEVRGWASTMIVMLFGFGAVLFSLGVIAEYIGVAVKTAMGKPPYLIVSDPASGPLGRRNATEPPA